MSAAIVVVMGVSGCGKSTLGHALAEALGVGYLEGDDLHPRQNVERMAAGIALTDDDRQGWLQAIAERLSMATSKGQGLVVSCSALKRSYRNLLRAAAPGLRLVHLSGSPALLGERLAQRSGHYMPAALLQSQLLTLEQPDADEHAIKINIAQPLAAQLTLVRQALAPGQA